MKKLILLTIALLLTQVSLAQETPVSLLLTQAVVEDEYSIHEQIFALIGEDLVEIAQGYNPKLSITGLVAFRDVTDDDLIIIDPLSGQTSFVAHTSPGSNHFWSPDGSSLLYSDQSENTNNLVLWANGEVVHIFSFTSSIILHGWYDNSNLIVDVCTGRASCTLSQFSIETGIITPLTAEGYPKISLDVSTNGLVAYASRDGLFVLGNVESTLVDQLGSSAQWSLDGQQLVYLDWDGDIRLHDLQTEQNTRLVNGTNSIVLGQPQWMGQLVIFTVQTLEDNLISTRTIDPQTGQEEQLFLDYQPFRIVLPE